MQAASKIPEDRASIHTGPGKNSTWQRRLTLLAMCIAQGMILLDVTIVNIALPSIQRELHASSGELEWVISAYALSLAVLIPLSGSLGDRFGRKRFFAAGMVVFALGSVACALSASALELIAARALQGVGGAIMSALALSILSETYSGKARAGAIGIWATVAGLGFGLGPVVGGHPVPGDGTIRRTPQPPAASEGDRRRRLPGDGGRHPHLQHAYTFIAVHHRRDRLRALRHRNRDVDSRGRQCRHAGRPARPVGHRVGSIQRLPPSGHLDRPGDPRRHRCRRRNLRMDKSGRTSARRCPAGGDRASPQRRQRPHQLGDQGARDGSPASRRTGLLSRLSGGSPHRRTWPHRRRDHRRIRATRQPQTRAGRSRRQACTTRRPR